jgi:TAP-like protein
LPGETIVRKGDPAERFFESGEVEGTQSAQEEIHGLAMRVRRLLRRGRPAREPVSAWPKVIRQLTSVGPLWGPVLGWWQWAPCAANWPGRSGDRYAGPWNRTTKNPTLLINNLHDPADNYRNAQRAQRLLGNAVLLTNAGYGHPTFSDPSQCIDKWRTRYVVYLRTPPRGTVCQPDRQPFDPNFGAPLVGETPLPPTPGDPIQGG